MKRYLTFFFKVLVSLGLLFYLFRHTDFTALGQTIRRIKITWFIAAFLCYVIFQMVSTLRWQLICRSLGFKRGYLYFLKLYFINQYFNAFLPGLLGGDIIRVGYLLKDGASKTAATLSVFYDRAFGFLGALFLVLITLPYEGDFLPLGPRHTLYVFCSVGIFLALGLVLIKRFWRSASGRSFWALAAEVFAPQVFGVLFILGLLVQILYSVHIYFLGHGLGLSLPVVRYLIIVPVMGVLAAMPVSLGGLGVREGTLVYFLKLLGYGAEYGLALGLLVYAVALLGGAIGGLVYLARKAEGPSEKDA